MWFWQERAIIALEQHLFRGGSKLIEQTLRKLFVLYFSANSYEYMNEFHE